MFFEFELSYSFSMYNFWKNIFFYLLGTNHQNYVYSHVSYVHPEFILANRNVAILHVTSQWIVLTMTSLQMDILNFAK